MATLRDDGLSGATTSAMRTRSATSSFSELHPSVDVAVSVSSASAVRLPSSWHSTRVSLIRVKLAHGETVASEGGNVPSTTTTSVDQMPISLGVTDVMTGTGSTTTSSSETPYAFVTTTAPESPRAASRQTRRCRACETMAHGVPPIVTDVSSKSRWSPRIVAQSAHVVPVCRVIEVTVAGCGKSSSVTVTLVTRGTTAAKSSSLVVTVSVISHREPSTNHSSSLADASFTVWSVDQDAAENVNGPLAVTRVQLDVTETVTAACGLAPRCSSHVPMPPFSEISMASKPRSTSSAASSSVTTMRAASNVSSYSEESDVAVACSVALGATSLMTTLLSATRTVTAW